MKTYLLAIHQETDGEVPSREALDKIMQDVERIREDMKAAGAWIFSGGLDAPTTATRVRRRGKDVLSTDGPFAESKEYIAGLTIVQAPHLDAALEWARKLVQATGLSMEVRSFLEQ
jgi:hypothetical protein